MSEKELKRLQEFSKLNSLRECPVCNGELEKGYVHSSEGLLGYEEADMANMAGFKF